jgi:hypothetical protein
VREAIRERAAAYTVHGFTHDDFVSSRYVRPPRIRELLSTGMIDDTLRRQTHGPFPPPGSEEVT